MTTMARFFCVTSALEMDFWSVLEWLRQAQQPIPAGPPLAADQAVMRSHGVTFEPVPYILFLTGDYAWNNNADRWQAIAHNPSHLLLSAISVAERYGVETQLDSSIARMTSLICGPAERLAPPGADEPAQPSYIAISSFFEIGDIQRPALVCPQSLSVQLGLIATLCHSTH